MSRLISSLKKNADFSTKVNLYFHNDLLFNNSYQHLKMIWGIRDYKEVINKCLFICTFSKLKLSKELYSQLELNNNIDNFLRNQDKFRETISLKEYETHYKKVSVLKWHLVVCLNNAEPYKIESKEFLNELVKSTEYILEDSSRFNEKYSKEKTQVSFSSLEKIEWYYLKELYGNYSKAKIIKRCIELYSLNHFSNIDSNHNEYEKIHEVNKNHTMINTIEIKLSQSEKRMLEENERTIFNADNVINYSLNIHNNLFLKGR